MKWNTGYPPKGGRYITLHERDFDDNRSDVSSNVFNLKKQKWNSGHVIGWIDMPDQISKSEGIIGG